MLAAGAPAPAFTLNGLDGKPVSPAGVGLLVFFKVTCPTCQLALPFIQRLADRSPVPVIGISQDDAAATRAFNETYGVRFPTLIDPKARNYAVSNAYRITHVPSLFLVGADGRIEWSGHGFDKAALEHLASQGKVPLFTPEDRVPEFKPG